MATETSGTLIHGLTGRYELPDWPALTPAELTMVMEQYPALGKLQQILAHSPRPFSSGALVEASREKVFVKRHPDAVRNTQELLEEHRFIAALAECAWPGGRPLVVPPLRNRKGETVVRSGKWTYELYPANPGFDLYRERQSWTPYLSPSQAEAAGNAMARMHGAAAGFNPPPRKTKRLVSSSTLFAADGRPCDALETGFNAVADCAEAGVADVEDRDAQQPRKREARSAEEAQEMLLRRFAAYLAERPQLQLYAEQQAWKQSVRELITPFYLQLQPWLAGLKPLWTHNDFHGSNLMWSDPSSEAEVTAIIDFGLSDRASAVYDIATAIERSFIEWLHIEEPGGAPVHPDQVAAFLAGYEAVRPLPADEAQAVARMLPLVHCEFALSETEYFLGVLHSQEKAQLGYAGYFLGHVHWFKTEQGRKLLAQLQQWADRKLSDAVTPDHHAPGAAARHASRPSIEPEGQPDAAHRQGEQ